VPDVHAQRDLWLLSVPAKRALADQQADEQAVVEVGELIHDPMFYNTIETAVSL